jgi:hypothetical protein
MREHLVPLFRDPLAAPHRLANSVNGIIVWQQAWHRHLLHQPHDKLYESDLGVLNAEVTAWTARFKTPLLQIRQTIWSGR